MFDFACMSFGFDFVYFSNLSIGIRDDNQDRLRHSRVSQHASVRRKRVRHSRPPIDASSFDVEPSIVSPLNSSSLRHVSPVVAPEAPHVHIDAPDVDASVYDVDLEVFGGGPMTLQ